MKMVIFLLVVALGFMIYRGILISDSVPLSQTESKPVDVIEAAQQQLWRDKAREKAAEKKKEVKPAAVGLDVFTKEKSSFVAQQQWLESHRVKDKERTMLDKLRNWATFGKYE